MRTHGRVLLVAAALAAPLQASAQEPSVRQQLEARGLPPGLIQEVSTIAADVSAQGLPPEMLVDKAVEGWAKHVPEPRIVAVVRQQSQLLVQSREMLRIRGMDAPSGPVITATAEAMGRGLNAEQVGAVLEAAPTPEAAGPGLRVAAALAAQGLGNQQAVEVVVRAMHRGDTAEDLLNMPSYARALQMQGIGAAQIGQRLMEGGGAMRGAGTGPGMGTRPPAVPPDPGKRQRRP